VGSAVSVPVAAGPTEAIAEDPGNSGDDDDLEQAQQGEDHPGDDPERHDGGDDHEHRDGDVAAGARRHGAGPGVHDLDGPAGGDAARVTVPAGPALRSAGA
jgi:hypothetical protein